MGFKGIRETVDQRLAMLSVVLIKQGQFRQVASAAQLIQPQSPPSAVIKQAMEIGAHHGTVVVLNDPAAVIRLAQGLNVVRETRWQDTGSAVVQLEPVQLTVLRPGRCETSLLGCVS